MADNTRKGTVEVTEHKLETNGKESVTLEFNSDGPITNDEVVKAIKESNKPKH
ncbi:hypothetical protein [Salibacterium salarium]|uniref:hypothetical protein n=1 Tax=Salibacterium salarium TaxID=284579 RepID=UPI0016398417|nr:hypothetical protein [Salibacterium salarium]